MEMINRMMDNETEKIEVFGARVHNLKNVDVELPRNSLTVITGLSGVGSLHWLSIRYSPKGSVAT